MTPHLIHPTLLQGTVKVALAGCGGTGSQVLTGLARLDRALCALGHPGGLAVTAWDPDLVSEANVGRQLFYPADVGHPKAVVLVHRVNAAFGLAWDALTLSYPSPPDAVRRAGGEPWEPQILVSCVDTARARREIARHLHATNRQGVLYWLDLGNRERDGQAILGEPTVQRVQTKHRGGFDAYRTKERQPRLPLVTELFPELMDESRKEDDRPSCSLAEALEVQDLFINQAVATWGLTLLWDLFRQGSLERHGYFVNLASGRVAGLPVPQPAAKAKRKRPARTEHRQPLAA